MSLENSNNDGTSENHAMGNLTDFGEGVLHTAVERAVNGIAQLVKP